MAGLAGRLDILWVPQESNAFVTLGSELRLFRIRKTAPNEPIKVGQQRLGHDHSSESDIVRACACDCMHACWLVRKEISVRLRVTFFEGLSVRPFIAQDLKS